MAALYTSDQPTPGLKYSGEEFSGKYFDIWVHSSPVSQEGNISSDDGLIRYLKGQYPEEGSLGNKRRLRLLIQHYPKEMPALVERKLPFSNQDIHKIIQKTFKLPLVFEKTFILATGVAMMTTGGNGIGILLQQQLLKNEFWTLILSYDPDSEVTCCLIGYQPNASINDILDFVKTNTELALHPLLLPAYAFETMVTQLGKNISEVRYKTLELDNRIEISQRDTQTQTVAPTQTDAPTQIDVSTQTGPSEQLQSSPTTVVPFDNDLANKAFLATHHHLSNGHLELTIDMGRLISQVFELPNAQMRQNQWHTCLKRYFDDNAALMKRFEQAAAAYTRKMETLGVVYNNRVAQDNNAISLAIAMNSHRLSSENARDSAAMKVIAFLANLLLPSSFLWSLYSAPIVENRVRWWYYLFSIPITLSFFAVWLVWYSRLDWGLVKKENNANREMENLSLQYQQRHNDGIKTEKLWSHKMWDRYEQWLSKSREKKPDDKV